MSSESRPSYLRPLLLATLLLGFGLRTFRLGYQELRGDETFGYLFSLPSFAQIIERTFELQEPHPVASYLVQSAWLDWAGHSEFALRFPSAWFSLLAVALLVRFASALAFRPAAIVLSGLLLAISPYAIWHAQDARMYSMSLALTIASSWLFVALLFRTGIFTQGRIYPLMNLKEPIQSGLVERSGSGGSALSTLTPILMIVAYLLVTWMALHTHYFTAFIVISQNLFVLLLLTTAFLSLRAFVGWLTVQIGLSLAYLPWLIPARSILVDYGGNGDSPGFFEMLGRAARTFAFGETIADPWVWAAAAVILFGVVMQPRANRLRTGYLLLYLLVPLVATWISALQRPIFDERYLVAAAPPFLLLVGGGLSLPFQKVQQNRGAQQERYFWGIAMKLIPAALAVAIGIGVVTSLSNHYTNASYSKTIGWRQLAQTLDHLSSGYAPESTRLVQNYPDPTLWYYYDGDVEHLVLPPQPNDEAGTLRELTQLQSAEPDAEPNAESPTVQHLLIALQPAENWDNRGIAERALSSEFTLIAETTVESWPVQVYARPPDRLAQVSGGAFVNGLVLSHAVITPAEAVPGGVLSIHLGWSASAGQELELSGTEKLFLHLIGPDGALIAQKDMPLQVEGSDEFSQAIAAQKSVVDTPAAVASYGILLPSDAPSYAQADVQVDAQSGGYRLIAGIYDPAQSGAPRILTESGGDSVTLAELTIQK